ncbi:MAG: osmotically inducible protein C [Rhodobacteraceae bacterium CG17_big_fil_post_rev_8_21_14_2_50_63_15]|nr:OsmC family protein [Roseovarius sp.]PIV79227.1 MAG: osmotically inducible protein C [Rhodobacteraceae bacterium CG17_big_fil_post_rev_8_21_14_2_50_63_15]
MLDYHITARRIDSHGSEAMTKQARIVLDTDMAGRADAFNPAEMLLASLAACILKGTERVIPMLKFELRGIEVSLHGIRQDSPPKMIRIAYDIVVDTDESDARLDLLHRNLQKYGTIMNTLAGATELVGTIQRKLPEQD